LRVSRVVVDHRYGCEAGRAQRRRRRRSWSAISRALGRDWRKQGDPEEVRVHDFLIKEIGRVVPYGIL
jgi:hypothetical protein